MNVFKFESIGQEVFGKFKVFQEKKKYHGKYFLILEKENNDVLVNCSTDLVNKMQYLLDNDLISKGTCILIRYIADKDTKFRSALKVFEVCLRD